MFYDGKMRYFNRIQFAVLSLILLVSFLFGDFVQAATQGSLQSGNAVLTVDVSSGVALSLSGQTRFQRNDPLEVEWVDSADSAYWADNSYDNILVNSSTQLTCTGSVSSSNGSQLTFTDIYTVYDNSGTFHLSRSVDVNTAMASDSGFSTRFVLNTANAASIMDYNYLSPGTWYKQNQYTPTGAIASNSRLATDDDFFYFTTNCPGGPFLMMQDISTGIHYTIAQDDPAPSSSFSDDAGRSRIIDENIQYGALGVRKEAKPFMGFVYPGSEGDRTYVGGGSGEWALRSHPVKTGISHNYKLFIRMNSDADFNAAAQNTIRYFWDIYDPSDNIVLTDLSNAYDASISLIYDLCEPRGPANVLGIAWSVNILDGTVLNPSYEMGWIGSQFQGAYHLLRYGLKNNSSTHETYGKEILDFWANNSWPASNALPYKWNAGGWGSNWSKNGNLRHYGDGFHAMVRSYVLAKSHGNDYSNWLNYCTKFGDWLVANQDADGAWFNKLKVADGAPYDNPTRSGTPYLIPFLIDLYNVTKTRSYLDTAISAGNFAYAQGYLTGYYTGGAIDNGDVIDKESVLLNLRSFISLYEATGDNRWLTAAEHAAVFGMTWTFVWDMEIPAANYANLFYGPTYYTSGQGRVALGHGYCDFYAARHAGDYFRLYQLTGDKRYKTETDLLIHNSMQLMDIPSSIAHNKTFHTGACPEGISSSAMGRARGRTTSSDAWLGFVSTARLGGITDIEDYSAISNDKFLEWKFDGSTNDTSSSGNHGVITEGSPGSVEYVAGDTIQFNNNKDRVVSPAVNLGNEFTVSGWIKVADGFSGSWNRFICTDDAYTGFFIGQSGNSMQWKFAVNNGWALPLAGSILPGQWQHVAGTYDGTYGCLYVDGVLVSGPAIMSPPSVPNQPIVLGKDAPAHEKSFPGQFEDIRIYKRALNAAEIQSLNSSQIDHCLNPSGYDLDGDCQVSLSDLVLLSENWLDDLPGIAESHLLGDWPLDTNAKDSSGNSNNGTPLPAQVGSISFTSDGQNGSIRFANSKDRVVFSTIDIGSAFTVAGWIKVADGFSGSWNRFLCTDDHKTGFFIGQDADSGKWKFAVNDGWALPLAGSILPGQWQHVAATYDGSSGRLYIDGQFVAGPSAMPVPSDPQQQFVLGRDKKTYNKGFPGSFDEIKLYSRALTDAEIKSLYSMKTKSCVASSDYDLNGDCKISFPDLVLLAAKWLECGRLESCE